MNIHKRLVMQHHLYLSTPLRVETNELNKDDEDQQCDSEEPNRMRHGNSTEIFDKFLNFCARLCR